MTSDPFFAVKTALLALLALFLVALVASKPTISSAFKIAEPLITTTSLSVPDEPPKSFTLSVPDAMVIISAPSPPVIISFPIPPSIVSTPALPTMVSAPPPPVMVSLLPAVSIAMSTCGVSRLVSVLAPLSLALDWLCHLELSRLLLKKESTPKFGRFESMLKRGDRRIELKLKNASYSPTT